VGQRHHVDDCGADTPRPPLRERNGAKPSGLHRSFST
jgi:hypothetical protein